MTANGTLLRSTYGLHQSVEGAGAILTAHATPHSKGAWADVLTAANNVHGCDLISVTLWNTQVAATDTSMAIDIGIGDAASEVVVFEGLLAGFAANRSPRNFVFPLYIPPGVRVAARCQALIVSDWVEVAFHLMSGSGWGDPNLSRGKWESYGFSAAASGSTVFPVGNATPSTEGAWVEATASTTREHRYFFTSVQLRDNAAGAQVCGMDIGVGAAASEVVLIPDTIWTVPDSTEVVTGPFPAHMPLLRPVPAGSRLAVRINSNIASYAELEVVVHAY